MAPRFLLSTLSFLTFPDPPDSPLSPVLGVEVCLQPQFSDRSRNSHQRSLCSPSSLGQNEDFHGLTSPSLNGSAVSCFDSRLWNSPVAGASVGLSSLPPPGQAPACLESLRDVSIRPSMLHRSDWVDDSFLRGDSKSESGVDSTFRRCFRKFCLIN